MINGLFNIGNSALNASQAWINVTGNNLANADTEGYSRQYVDQKDAGGLTYKPGAQPLGVNAQQIMRFFDQFLERSYVSQSTNSSRWDNQDTILSTVENLFNESNRAGLSSSLVNFFNAWQDLALRPDDTSVRQSLLSYADNLVDMFSNTSNTLKAIQDEMDVNIRSGVNRVNEIAKAIADLNNQITRRTVDGISNPNALLDKRDQLVRELATYVDVETIDSGKGHFRVQLKTGQPLVDGIETYSLDFRGAYAENRLVGGSSYQGKVEFEGNDDFEYTLEIVKDPETGEANQFRVSLDNGKTWIKDANGKDTYTIEPGEPVLDENGKTIGYKSQPVKVKELTITFTDFEGFSAGDKFDITPKSGLYWIEPTRGPQNITPQMYTNGQENPDRVNGGKLAAYFFVRDDNIGRYKDELDATANALIWEVNRIHSQGAGLSMLETATGTQSVANENVPLGSDQAMLPYGDRLQPGNVNFYFYDKNITTDQDEKYIGNAFINFDPANHSLQDVKDAINNMRVFDKEGLPVVTDKMGNGVSPLLADIQDGKLVIRINPEAKQKVEFAMGADTSGLMAALGINSFFTGSSASDLGVNNEVHINKNLIAAGAVNGQYQVNAGDNSTANAIGKLIDKPVKINTFWKTEENQSINQYYANLVATVGSDKRLAKTNNEYHTALTTDLFDRVSAVTGVNMDEEMSNLIKFQHSYTAAAKLITTADQMLQTLLGMKQ